jgi:hypothetical protein
MSSSMVPAAPQGDLAWFENLSFGFPNIISTMP